MHGEFLGHFSSCSRFSCEVFHWLESAIPVEGQLSPGQAVGGPGLRFCLSSGCLVCLPVLQVCPCPWMVALSRREMSVSHHCVMSVLLCGLFFFWCVVTAHIACKKKKKKAVVCEMESCFSGFSLCFSRICVFGRKRRFAACFYSCGRAFWLSDSLHAVPSTATALRWKLAGFAFPIDGEHRRRALELRLLPGARGY